MAHDNFTGSKKAKEQAKVQNYMFIKKGKIVSLPNLDHCLTTEIVQETDKNKIQTTLGRQRQVDL